MEKRRALLVGAGNWGQNWARYLDAADQVTIAGWIDLRARAAAEASQALGIDVTYAGTNLDQALEATEPDFVVNAVVPSAHRDVAVAALEAGVPVLCEKPMADTMEHARLMVAAAERSGKLLMISQQRRYDPRLAAMRRLIVEHVGALGILNSDFYRRHPEAGFHRDMPSPLLLDMAIHTFDAARYVSGTDPISVYCEDFNPSWSWFSGNAAMTAIFEMTNGLRYTYRGSWCNQGWNTAWEAEWRAMGPDGTVLWDGETAPEAEIIVENSTFPSETMRIVGEPDPNAPQSLAAPLQDFLHALETGAVPMGECHDNIKSLAMVLGAVESGTTGRRVEIRI